MIKRFAFGIAAVAAAYFAASVAFCTDASARDWYVKAEVGQAMDTEVAGFALSDDLAMGAYLGTGVGPLRVEAGLTRIEADLAPASIDALYYNATAYLDLYGGLFVGGGAGYVEAEAEFGPASFTDSGWAWHASAGYARQFADGVIGEVQVRYVDAELDTVGEATSVVATVGLRVAL